MECCRSVVSLPLRTHALVLPRCVEVKIIIVLEGVQMAFLPDYTALGTCSWLYQLQGKLSRSGIFQSLTLSSCNFYCCPYKQPDRKRLILICRENVLKLHNSQLLILAKKNCYEYSLISFSTLPGALCFSAAYLKQLVRGHFLAWWRCFYDDVQHTALSLTSSYKFLSSQCEVQIKCNV